MKPLEKLVNSVTRLHRREIVPAKNKISVARQMLLFAGAGIKMYHHVSLGNYYESMTAALWGGKLTNRVHVLRNGSSGEIASDSSEDAEENPLSDDLFQEDEVPFEIEGEGLIKPDLVDRDGKAIGESKAWRSGHSCNLIDAQIYRYKEIQIKEPESEVYFAFYRHDLKKVKSFQGTEEDLFREMTSRTYFAVRLPFSTILAMHELGKQRTKPKFFRRWDDERKFPGCTILRSPLLNSLLSDTKGTFEELELNSRDYVFERYKSPKDFEIEGNAIRQFPILCAHDRNHKKWVARFVSENSILAKRQEYDPRADGCSDA